MSFAATPAGVADTQTRGGIAEALIRIVTAIALMVGLPTLYFAKATFGSFGDYIAILTWAIGVDQGKNLIQLMKTYPADGAAISNP